MTAIKTFTTLGSMIVFAGFASSASAAINSEKINSNMDFSVASDEKPEDMTYEPSGDSDCSDAGIPNSETWTGKKRLPYTTGVIERTIEWGEFNSSLAPTIETSQTFLTTQYVNRKPIVHTNNVGAPYAPTNGVCGSVAGANKYTFVNVNGATMCQAQYTWTTYTCEYGQCFYCDMCFAGSYQSCWTAATYHDKNTDRKERECWSTGAEEFYENLANGIKALLSNETEAANFLIATRYIHYDKLGETGKYSAEAEAAFLKVLNSTGLISKADDFYRKLAESTADPDTKYAEALTHAVQVEEMKQAANGG